VISPNGPGYKTSLPLKDESQISQLPLHPSMHRVQMPDIGTTSRERFTVPVASFAFGCRRFIIHSDKIFLQSFDYFNARLSDNVLKQNSFNLRSLISACFPPYLKGFAFFRSFSHKFRKKSIIFDRKNEKMIKNLIRISDLDHLIMAAAHTEFFRIMDLLVPFSVLPCTAEFVLPLPVVSLQE
jgi:hypothetical protein